MNFEPADPPLLDPDILERFTEEEIKKQEQTLRHKYVLKKLADFLPKQSPSVKQTVAQPQEMCPDAVTINAHISNQLSKSSIFPFPAARFPPNVHVQNSTAPFSFMPRDTSRPLLSPPSHVTSLKPPSPSDRPTNVVKPRATKRFTYSQSVVLEEFFQKYGSARIVDRIALAQKLGLYKNDVIGWFQSRRRKERRATTGSTNSYSSPGDQNSFVQNSNNVHIFSSGVRWDQSVRM